MIKSDYETPLCEVHEFYSEGKIMLTSGWGEEGAPGSDPIIDDDWLVF